MYSIVLMMAMSGSAEMPECHRNRCCGCSGGYYASRGCYGGYGCSGGYGCYGGSGCYGCYGSTYPAVVPPGQSMPPPAQKMPPAPPPPPPQKTGLSDSASVRVTLPADAVLTVDGTRTQSVSANRLFVTPALRPGVTLHYVFKAQIVRQGQTIMQTQTVPVQAGQETKVQFQFADVALSAAR